MPPKRVLLVGDYAQRDFREVVAWLEEHTQLALALSVAEGLAAMSVEGAARSAVEPDVAAEKTVIIGFKIADIYPELFTFEKGDRKGQPGVSIKGRLLRVKFAKVNGEALDLPQPARSSEPESVAA